MKRQLALAKKRLSLEKKNIQQPWTGAVQGPVPPAIAPSPVPTIFAPAPPTFAWTFGPRTTVPVVPPVPPYYRVFQGDPYAGPPAAWLNHATSAGLGVPPLSRPVLGNLTNNAVDLDEAKIAADFEAKVQAGLKAALEQRRI